MNKEHFLGRWKELKGKIKEKWGKLTDDDITQINGKWDQLCGMLQKKYGWTKEHTEQEMNDWCSSCEHKGMRHDMKEFKKDSKGCCDREHKREGCDYNAERSSMGDEHKNKKRKAG